jgi:hypothetical protein
MKTISPPRKYPAKKFRKVLVLVIGAFTTLSALVRSPAHADEASVKHAADSLVKAFIGGCVQVMPNVDRIETSAKALGWKELDQTAAAMFAPPSPTAKWKAWLVKEGADVPFFLGISQGTANGKSISVCAVVNPYAPPSPVRAALTKMLSLGEPLRTEIDGGQQYTYWLTKFMDKEIIISFIDTTPMEETGVNIAVTSIQ